MAGIPPLGKALACLLSLVPARWAVSPFSGACGPSHCPAARAVQGPCVLRVMGHVGERGRRFGGGVCPLSSHLVFVVTGWLTLCANYAWFNQEAVER